MRLLLSSPPGRVAVSLVVLGALGDWVGWGWAIPCAIVAYLATGPTLERRLETERWLDVPPDPQALTGHASSAPRQVGYCGEIGMGGPTFGDVLLPDGAILRGVSDRGGVQRIGDGPLFRAACLQRSGETALVYDSANQRIHDLDLPADTPVSRLLAACAADPAPVRLRPVLGLLLDRETPAPARVLERHLPSGRVLGASLLVPDDLRGATNPEHWATLAPYRLDVEGRSTRIHVKNLEECVESPSGDAFALRGMRLNRYGGSLWHVWHRGEFHAVEANLEASDGASCSLEAPRLADGGQVTWRVAHTRWEPDAGELALPPPTTVQVRAHWVRSPLHLTSRDGTVTIRLPEKLPPEALRYWA